MRRAPIYPGTDHYVRLRGLRDPEAAVNTYVTNATVTYSFMDETDSSTVATGSLSYVESPGYYRGVCESSAFTVVVGRNYRLTVDASAGSYNRRFVKRLVGTLPEDEVE